MNKQIHPNSREGVSERLSSSSKTSAKNIYDEKNDSEIYSNGLECDKENARKRELERGNRRVKKEK